MNGDGRTGTAPVLELRGITKRFGDLVANRDVTFDVEEGEIHALLGENGAGKSTLMNVASGLLRPDAGTVVVRGRELVLRGAADAIDAGIGMVHQHFHLVDTLTVAENIVLHEEPGTVFSTDRRAAERAVAELAERSGLAVDPTALVRDLSVAMQQRVEILKALYRRADVLLLDEPTAVLAPAEVRELLGMLRRLAADGTAIVLITHKLDEATQLSDRLTVLRGGEVVARFVRGQATGQDLAAAMVGREVATVTAPPRVPGRLVMSIRDLAANDPRGLRALTGFSLDLHAGEIVGIAGVDGNGQTELIEALSGLGRVSGGSAELLGRPLAFENPRQILGQGVAHVPADRRKHGLVLDFSLVDNFAMRGYYRAPYSRGGFLSRRGARRMCVAGMELYGVRAQSPDARANELSGGNQQKLILAREMSSKPVVLLASQPTRGLDVGSIETVHRNLIDARDEGCAVLLVSFELEEILALSTRVLVLYEGRVVLDAPRSAVDRESVGAAMTGAVAA